MMMLIVKRLLSTRNREETIETYRAVYEQFKTLPPEEIAFRSGIASFDKYSSQANGFLLAKRTPIAVSGAIHYNNLLKEFNLTGKYDAINSNVRIRWVYCEPTNKYKMSNIAFLDTIPVEFGNIKPDYEKMFKKIMEPAIERLFECAKWKLVDFQSEYTVDLLDFLKN